MLVEGVNRVKQHTKVGQTGPRRARPAASSRSEAPIHVCNVMLVVEDDGNKVGTRVEATAVDDDGHTKRARLAQADR